MKLSIKACILVNMLLSIAFIAAIALGTNAYIEHHLYQHTSQALSHSIPADTIIISPRQLFITLATSLSVLAIMIWLISSFALRGIKYITREIESRTAGRINTGARRKTAKELRPLTDAIDQLFDRLHSNAEKEKKFAADAAHELRTPLAVISTHAQVALNCDDINECKEGLTKVVTGIKRSTHIVQQLLNLSRMNPDAPSKPEEVDIHQRAQNIIADLALKAIDKNITIELHASGQFIVKTNPASIDILMRNIIDNAINYTQNGGRVTTRINKKPEYISFSVEDNGPGIPKELRERVFDRFYRVTGNKADGSGLGLGIVKQIAALHDAQIELSSPSFGTGLIFTVKFPNSK